MQFQKRGLPHTHILITFAGDSNPAPDKCDNYVSAELPDPDSQPRLFHCVVSGMLHGDCGTKCEKDGRCFKHCLKHFQDDTIFSQEGYPINRRR